MKKDQLDNKISRILNEEETFMLCLILLAHMHDDTKYKELSDIIFLFDNYKGFKQFIKYYEGQTITIPTAMELKQTLRLLTMFQKVYLDNKDFNECYDNLSMASLGLTQDYCKKQLNKFKELLKNDGAVTLTKLRRISKKFNNSDK